MVDRLDNSRLSERRRVTYRPHWSYSHDSVQVKPAAGHTITLHYARPSFSHTEVDPIGHTRS